MAMKLTVPDTAEMSRARVFPAANPGLARLESVVLDVVATMSEVIIFVPAEPGDDLSSTLNVTEVPPKT